MDDRLSNQLTAAEDALDRGQLDEATRLIENAEEIQLSERTLREVTKQVDIGALKAEVALHAGRVEDAFNTFEKLLSCIRPFDRMTELEFRIKFSRQINGSIQGDRLVKKKLSLDLVEVSFDFVEPGSLDWAWVMYTKASLMCDYADEEIRNEHDFLRIEESALCFEQAIAALDQEKQNLELAIFNEGLAKPLSCLEKYFRKTGSEKKAFRYLNRIDVVLSSAIDCFDPETQPRSWLSCSDHLARANLMRLFYSPTDPVVVLLRTLDLLEGCIDLRPRFAPDWVFWLHTYTLAGFTILQITGHEKNANSHSLLVRARSYFDFVEQVYGKVFKDYDAWNPASRILDARDEVERRLKFLEV